jgi:hypothetical protein
MPPRANPFRLRAPYIVQRRDEMATIMLMHWPEVTETQYQEARKIVNWEGQVPRGAKFHTAWFAEDGFHVLDLWESRDDFETFVRERLAPGVAQVGIVGQPNVQFENATAVFAPNVT